MHHMDYIQLVALPFTSPDGFIIPVVHIPNNGCPPPVVASVTYNPCTYTYIGNICNMSESCK
jgi:hypothetical protein